MEIKDTFYQQSVSNKIIITDEGISLSALITIAKMYGVNNNNVYICSKSNKLNIEFEKIENVDYN